MPLSERQQMLLLKKQQEEEEEAAAEQESQDESQDDEAPAKSTRRTSKRTATKKKAKRKKMSLDERKKLAREKAAAKKQEEELSASIIEEENTSQEEEIGDIDSSSEEEFEEEALRKKKPAGKKERTTKKRRLSEDEESSQNEDEVDKPTERKRRLTTLNRKRKRQTSVTLSDSESDKEMTNEDVVDDKINTTVPKKAPIPKKGGIPKKGDIPRRKASDAAASGGESKPSSSLLQNMAPGNPSVQTTSMNMTSASLLSKSMQPHPSMTKPPLRSAEGDAAVHVRKLPQPPSAMNSIQQMPVQPGYGGMTPPQPGYGGMTPPPRIEGQAQPPRPSQPTPPSFQSAEENENRVLQAIGNMCDSLNKDGRFQIRTGPAIDMSGSFLSDERYDFFDVDSHGDIMLQAKIPIFPEDFPPGKTEWPLAWWGIVDPALAPSPKVVEVEELSGSQERTAAVKVWPTRPSEQQQQPQPTQRQQYQQPPPPHHPPNVGLSPPHARPPPPFPPPPHGRGDFGRGAPFSQGRGGRGPTQFPPGGSRGRRMRPGERPPHPRPDNWRPPPGHY